MEKEFIPYEEALELKELGFDEDCLGTYYEEDKSFYMNGVSYSNSYFTKAQEVITEHPLITTPLYQQAFRWFREKHRLNGEVNYLPNVGKFGIITSDMNVKPKDLSKNENFVRGKKVTSNYVKFDTYEEAELACLKKLIEIVNQNKDENS